MSTLVWICYGAFLLAYYYFVLRKFNSVGFRLFSVFTFTAIAVCYWWYSDDRDLKSFQQMGIATNAIVVKKGADDLTVRFTDETGREVVRTQEGGISIEEFAAVKVGQPAPILFKPNSKTIYLTSSYQRQLHDNVYFLVFPALLFAVGCGCWVFLRKYRIQPHEGTLYEYVTNESGKVLLDDAATPVTRGLRNVSTFSKLLTFFRR